MAPNESTDDSTHDSPLELPLSSTMSPQSPQSYQPGSKERCNPSITPRKFNRFFTPRPHRNRRFRSARQALNEIATPNRNVTQSSPLRPFRDVGGQENSPSSFPRGLKRRKTLHTPEASPEQSSAGTKEHGFLPAQYDGRMEVNGENPVSSPCERSVSRVGVAIDDEDYEEGERNLQVSSAPPKRIIPLVRRGVGGQRLNLAIRGSCGSGKQHGFFPVHDYQDETASFYSRPEDCHITTSIETPDRCIPFCTTSCNTNSLIAVGDEEGRVRLIESAKPGKPPFTNHFLAFRVHTNAIIDMEFSEDDTQLATASGDQTARVVDMSTQTTTAVLGYHSASLKQVRFQPGANNNNILATSSRDGTVQVWDLRCKGDDRPQHQIYLPIETLNSSRTRSTSRKVLYGRPVNSITNAHRPWNFNGIAQNRNDSFHEISASRPGDVSVTAVQFLPVGQEHLLLTASEADASIRLWDVRFLHSKHKSVQTPISIAKQPQSHSQWRNFGISSLNLSGDGSRLFALCKDNTVYTYSTSHLIVGHSPELRNAAGSRPCPQRGTQEGLGPIYGYRHPKFHATSFYVKSAIRKAKNGKCEMLAVGSSDGCAILFPTDPIYDPQPQYRELQHEDSTLSGALVNRPMLGRTGSSIRISGRVEDSIPISNSGTPLIRGHDREVGSLTWTNDGELITVGDDFLVRCWREGKESRNLRVEGETEGRRWGCGWADVDGKYDEDDDSI